MRGFDTLIEAETCHVEEGSHAIREYEAEELRERAAASELRKIRCTRMHGNSRAEDFYAVRESEDGELGHRELVGVVHIVQDGVPVQRAGFKG